MAGLLFSKDYRVKYFECNLLGNATLSNMINMVNLVSDDQTAEMGVGIDYVNKMGHGWVVIQYDIDINRLPQADEIVKLQTVASDIGKYFANREFWIRDQEDNSLVHFQSIWVMMDLKARKMIKIPDDAIAPFGLERSKKIKHLKKINALNDDEKTLSKSYNVRFTDIDWNGHVNNAHYLQWMVDSLSYDFLSTHVPASISIKFQEEVKYGDNVESNSQVVLNDGKVKTIHNISVDGTIKSIANIEWKEIKKETK